MKESNPHCGSSDDPQAVAALIERDNAEGDTKRVIIAIRFANKKGREFARAVFDQIYQDDGGTGKYLRGLGFSGKYGQIVGLPWARHGT